jgi:hypothetical protein
VKLIVATLKFFFPKAPKANDHKCYLVMKFEVFLNFVFSILAGKIMKFWVLTC